MKGKKKTEKTENRKWLFLGSAILLATVLIAVILNLPFTPGSIDGDGLNATLINDKATVELTASKITNSKTNDYTVKESDNLRLNVSKSGKHYWSTNLITKYKTGSQFVYCIELGTVVNLSDAPNRTATKKENSNYWKSLTTTQQDNMALILMYGFPNNNSLSGTEDQKYVATQILIWEIQQGWRTKFNASNTAPDNMTNASTKAIVYTKWVANDSGVKTVYNQIVKAIAGHKTAPKATSIVLKKNNNSYTGTVTGNYSGFTCQGNGTVTCEVNANGTLTVRSSSKLNSTQTITLTKILPSANAQGMLVLEHSKYQRMIVGKPALSVTTKVSVTTEKTGTLTIKKVTPDDNSTGEFQFLIKGSTTGYNNTITVNGGSSKKIEGLEIDEYEIQEINVSDKYIQPNKKVVILTSLNSEQTVTFENYLKNNSVVRVSKVDENGKLLAGAKLVLKDSNNKVVEGPWTSTESAYQIKTELKIGEKYKVCETEAPTGYIKTDKCEEFSINSKTDSKNITLKNTKEPNQVSIGKKDSETGELIGGAHLQLKDSTGSIIHEWVSEKGKKETISKNIIFGEKYTIVETTPPEGYFVSEPKEFEFSKNKMTVEMEDEPLYVEISKQDISTTKEIAGAHLQIKDSKGEIVDEWISEEGKTHIFKNKKNGGKLVYGESYTLVETIAPDGYSIAEEIVFVVGQDRQITMNNEVTKVIIKKLDTVTRKRVVGAHLQILDENGTVIDEHDTTNTDWVVYGLSTGKEYVIRETKVPEKYLKPEDVSFNIKPTENSIEVIVNNTPIVDVPDTAVDVNVVTIIAGVLFALSGVATIIWIKKRSA